MWAIQEIRTNGTKLTVYTDCQNILSLHDRREKFEKNNYRTGKKILIANHELYKEFFHITDSLDCTFVKVKGHKLSCEKDEIDTIFTLVDKASRNALREESMKPFSLR